MSIKIEHATEDVRGIKKDNFFYVYLAAKQIGYAYLIVYIDEVKNLMHPLNIYFNIN